MVSLARIASPEGLWGTRTAKEAHHDLNSTIETRSLWRDSKRRTKNACFLGRQHRAPDYPQRPGEPERLSALRDAIVIGALLAARLQFFVQSFVARLQFKPHRASVCCSGSGLDAD